MIIAIWNLAVKP